jgi:hypothetical protein
MAKYGLIITITPLATKTDKFPEGMPLINSEKQFIGKKTFGNPDQAEDYLFANGYSKGTGFYCKSTNGAFYNVAVTELI